MHVVKKELMYVSKPFGGEGGGRVCNARSMFFLKKISLRALRAHNVCTHYARTYILCTNAPRALHGVLLLGASKHG